jgi:hypothetical protein
LYYPIPLSVCQINRVWGRQTTVFPNAASVKEAMPDLNGSGLFLYRKKQGGWQKPIAGLFTCSFSFEQPKSERLTPLWKRNAVSSVILRISSNLGSIRVYRVVENM